MAAVCSFLSISAIAFIAVVESKTFSFANADNDFGGGQLDKFNEFCVAVDIDVGAYVTTATVVVPQDRWFGIGFGVSYMGGSIAVILNKDGVADGEVEMRYIGA